MLSRLIEDYRVELQAKVVNDFAFSFVNVSYSTFSFVDLSQSTSNQAVSSWSKLDASVKDVAFVRKPPHLRSKVTIFV